MQVSDNELHCNLGNMCDTIKNKYMFKWSFKIPNNQSESIHDEETKKT